ncbi:DUF2147 domain-containing protein [Martelella mediterranea]|uniref:DUF2147 domain-containing protein n=1 Tax=Martelella mediterranea TaxID=293089 RepID=UPI001E5CB962|nr:DUF2147 domain-containing protein [Martelella mediterranea]
MNRRNSFLLALPLAAAPGLAEASDLAGVWARGDGKARVLVEQCGNDLCATNVWVRPGTRNERVGDTLVMDVDPVGPSRYEGQARDVRRGLTYSMEISLDGAAMETRGCILGKLICKSANWTSMN